MVSSRPNPSADTHTMATTTANPATNDNLFAKKEILSLSSNPAGSSSSAVVNEKEDGNAHSNSSSISSSNNSTKNLESGALKPFPVSFVGGDRTALFTPASSSRQRHDLKSSGYYNSSSGATASSGAGTRKRTKSFTENIKLDQLKAPISVPLVFMCLGWYATSAFSNTLTKTILTQFPYPVSLSLVQFLLAVCFGVATITLAQNSHAVFNALPKGTVSHRGFRYPTKEIIMSTLPMGIFQLFGHIFSHKATSQIPVSLVHTIKALSPLFTVAAYRFVFGVQYEARTYLSLVPLVTGVVMTCSTQFSSQMNGILFALIAALIFVSQNIYSKKLLTYRQENNSVAGEGGNAPPKIDKLNILCYCSSLAFVFTFPIWLFSEGVTLGSDYFNQTGKYFGVPDLTDPVAATATAVAATTAGTSGLCLLVYFVLNGLSHFLQNLLAFQVLGMVSPVTYSVASLVKRIVVVSFSIVWFGQQVNALQGWGILLTFFGLYLYDRLGGDKHKNQPKKKILPL